MAGSRRRLALIMSHPHERKGRVEDGRGAGGASRVERALGATGRARLAPRCAARFRVRHGAWARSRTSERSVRGRGALSLLVLCLMAGRLRLGGYVFTPYLDSVYRTFTQP